MELGIAAPQVVAARLTRMALAGPQPSARDQREFKGMVAEKQQAFTQSWLAMWAETARQQQQLWLAAWRGPQALARQLDRSPQAVLAEGLAPVHRKATANARRLRKG
jgi:hypothetical protein